MLELTTLDIITRIGVAVGLGTIIGLERTLAGKTAGMRTYGMITLGSSVFVIISELIIASLPSPMIASPLVVPAAIVTGVGFLGAGLIIFQSNKITGLTTASGLWVASGIGIASAFGMFTLATITTIGSLIIFTAMWFLEEILKKFSYKTESESIAVEEEERLLKKENKFFNVK